MMFDPLLTQEIRVKKPYQEGRAGGRDWRAKWDYGAF